MKPVVRYEAAYNVEVDRQAFVRPVDHPSDLVSNMTWAQTSPVVKVDGDTFETENTRYVPISPA